jgi:hypothetical protein
MKKQLIIISIVLLPVLGIAQPDPRQNGDGSNVGGDPIGTSAPVGNGVAIMAILASGWYLRKAAKEKNKDS